MKPDHVILGCVVTPILTWIITYIICLCQMDLTLEYGFTLSQSMFHYPSRLVGTFGMALTAHFLSQFISLRRAYLDYHCPENKELHLRLYRVGMLSSIALLGVASVPCDVPDTTPIGQLAIHALFAFVTFGCLLYFIYMETAAIPTHKNKYWKRFWCASSVFGAFVLFVGIIYIVATKNRAAGMTIISIGEIWMVLSGILWLTTFIGKMNHVEIKVVQIMDPEIPM